VVVARETDKGSKEFLNDLGIHVLWFTDSGYSRIKGTVDL